MEVNTWATPEQGNHLPRKSVLLLWKESPSTTVCQRGQTPVVDGDSFEAFMIKKMHHLQLTAPRPRPST